MEKMNCDIIQDLIPSYVDGICSEASKNCVEEHIETCAECREMVVLCKNNALTGNQAEQKVLEGFRKIKEKMKYSRIANMLLLTVLVSFGVRTFLRRTSINNFIFLLSFTVLFAVCMCVNLVTGINRQGEQRAEKADYIICILSIIINISIPLLTYYCLQKNLTTPESILFGVGRAEIGPLIDRLIFAAFLIQLLFFFYHLLRMDKRKGNTAVLSCSAVTGIFLASVYHALFRRLDTLESFWAIFFQINTISIIIAMIGILISIFLGRKRRNS